jgi:hypothetical protein
MCKTPRIKYSNTEAIADRSHSKTNQSKLISVTFKHFPHKFQRSLECQRCSTPYTHSELMPFIWQHVPKSLQSGNTTEFQQHKSVSLRPIISHSRKIKSSEGPIKYVTLTTPFRLPRSVTYVTPLHGVKTSSCCFITSNYY